MKGVFLFATLALAFLVDVESHALASNLDGDSKLTGHPQAYEEKETQLDNSDMEENSGEKKDGTEEGNELATRDGDATFPNIGYMFRGYDVLEGNPMPFVKMLDPGFRQKIFKATFDDNKKTDDQRYKIPDNVDISSLKACTMSYSSQTINTQTEYQNDLMTRAAVSAGGSVGIYSGSFSMSAEYTSMKRELSSNEKIFIKTEAACMVYSANIQDQDPPEFTSNFVNAVRRLENGQLNFSRFISNFGTHYIKKVRMGSRFTLVKEISKESREKMDEEGVDVNVAASFSAGGFEASAEVGVKTTKKDIEKFNKAVETTKTSTIGTAPPADGSPLTWARDSHNDPLPVFYNLESIASLFHVAFFENIEPSINYNKVGTDLLAYLLGYCETRKQNNPTADCAGPPKGCGGGSSCSVNAICTDSGASYNCKCKPGYEGDGQTCRKEPKWTIGAILQHQNTRGKWGQFGGLEHCKNGIFAKGFLMKTEQALDGDDTAANAVCILCGTKRDTCSTIGNWGEWSDEQICPQGCFLSGWKQRVESERGNGDDTALNNVEYQCRKLEDWSVCDTGDQMKGKGTSWGSWSRWKVCPRGNFICGINTRVEPSDGDDTALNDIKHQCCRPT